jgi:acetyltransferase
MTKSAGNSGGFPDPAAVKAADAFSETWTLDDGTQVSCRPIRSEDADIEQAFVRGLSHDSRYSRFMGELSELTPQLLERFTHNHYPHDFALIVTVPKDGREQEIAVARYITLEGGDRCEYAIAVADEWQHHGIGHRLMVALMKLAREGGLRYMEGYVLATNSKMLELTASLGFESAPSDEGPQVRRVWRPL